MPSAETWQNVGIAAAGLGVLALAANEAVEDGYVQGFDGCACGTEYPATETFHGRDVTGGGGHWDHIGVTY